MFIQNISSVDRHTKHQNISLLAEICNVFASSDILYYIITLAKLHIQNFRNCLKLNLASTFSFL